MSERLTLRPLAEVGAPRLERFVVSAGISRFLEERPYVQGQRGRYLLARIAGDASGDDALALAALSGTSVVGLAVVRYPRWDREHFGFEVARIEHLQGSAGALASLTDSVLDDLGRRDVRLCSCRLSSEALPAIEALETRGFRFREATLTPWLDLSAWRRRRQVTTRPALPDDVEAMCAIARRAFRTDRFHRDDRIAAAAADGLYEKWVRTWHAEPRPERSSRVLLAGGAVVGFFMIELTRPLGSAGVAVAVIVLNAIDPAEAGQGFGYALYRESLDAASKQAGFASATIAAANTPVVNLYAKLGFRITTGGELTLHRWS